MKKKLLASLLVGSAVVGTSLAPLSAQATTTGKTPVTVGFEGGTLPDGNPDESNRVDPDPDGSNTNFDLLFIPREFDFRKLSITDDLTKPIPNKVDENFNGHMESVAVGDVRGTKEGWHLTAQSSGLTLGDSSIQGTITSVNTLAALTYDEENNTFTTTSTNHEVAPEIINGKSWVLPLGGEAVIMANASAGKGQGMWRMSMFSTSLNITTPAYDIKAGNYTGNITWNLVAGPSTPAPAPGPAN